MRGAGIAASAHPLRRVHLPPAGRKGQSDAPRSLRAGFYAHPAGLEPVPGRSAGRSVAEPPGDPCGGLRFFQPGGVQPL